MLVAFAESVKHSRSSSVAERARNRNHRSIPLGALAGGAVSEASSKSDLGRGIFQEERTLYLRRVRSWRSGPRVRRIRFINWRTTGA